MDVVGCMHSIIIYHPNLGNFVDKLNRAAKAADGTQQQAAMVPRVRSKKALE